MEEAQREAQALKICAARKVLAEATVAADTEIIPHEPEAKRKPKSLPRSTVEVAKLRKIQLQEAQETLAEEWRRLGEGGALVDAPIPETRRTRGRRPRKSKGSQGARFLKHCWVCGSVDHRTDTCPQAAHAVKARALERQLQALVKKQNEVKARLVTHLKYVQIAQRSDQYEMRAAHSCDVRPERTNYYACGQKTCMPIASRRVCCEI